MTGYESKKAMAQDKLDDDDDTQVYKDHGDALTIAYQSGYYDGKKAAQPAQEPPKYSFKAYLTEDNRIGVVACVVRPNGGAHILEEIIDAPKPAQESNFCPRCGKRTTDLTDIHTCTPPQKNT